MTNGVFVTGTGTGVGKTFITSILVHGLRRRGVDAVPAKPFQTGALTNAEGRLCAPDLLEAADSCDIQLTDEEEALLAPCLYEPACSPHLAAAMSGREPDLDAVLASLEKAGANRDFLVVEGAGGIMVPISDGVLMADFAARLGMPAVVVALAGLGTINHTLLTLGALRHRGIKIAGVILNEVNPADGDDEFIVEDNIRTITRLGGVPVAGRIPFRPTATPWPPAILEECGALLDIWKDLPEGARPA